MYRGSEVKTDQATWRQTGSDVQGAVKHREQREMADNKTKLEECDICRQTVRNNEKGIELEGCYRWLHWECIGLIKGEI